MKIARIPEVTKRWLILTLVLALVPFVAMAEDTAALNERLIEAANRGDVAMAKTFLDKGADVNAKDNEGRTSLIWAATKGHVNMVKLLLEKGADIDVRDKLGLTASKRARNHGQEEIVKLLKIHEAKE